MAVCAPGARRSRARDGTLGAGRGEAVLGVRRHPWGLGFSLLGPVGPFLKQHGRTSVPRGEMATWLRAEPPGVPQTWPLGSLPGPEPASLYLELAVTPRLASMLLPEGPHHLGPLVQAAPCHPSTREVPIPVTAPGWVRVSPQLRGVSVCRGPGLGPGECVPVCACVCVHVHV